MTERFLYLECIGVFGVTVYLSYLNILVRLYRDMIVFLHLQYDGGSVGVGVPASWTYISKDSVPAITRTLLWVSGNIFLLPAVAIPSARPVIE